MVSIGGALPSEAAPSLVNKCKTPVLICAGNSQSSITSTAEDKLKRDFEHLQLKRYRRPGDSMPSNTDEMRPIMQFLARRLLSRKGIPEDAVEIS